MDSTSLDVAEFIYDATVNFTEVTEYGVSMNQLLNGTVAPHAAGTRFDVAFQGEVRGPRLKGSIKGVDYLLVRADGRFELHIHAKITTDDGENISFFADGIAVVQEGTNLAQLRENVSFLTASPAYAWLNQLQGWAQGTVELEKGEIRVKAYAA